MKKLKLFYGILMVVIVALATSISTYAIEISKAITKAKLVSVRNKKIVKIDIYTSYWTQEGISQL